MNTSDLICDYIENELLGGSTESTIKYTDDLIESGVIDSLGIMSLLLFLEDKFSVTIAGEDLIPENFSTIEAITSLINRQLSA